jgi:hypothetical protein
VASGRAGCTTESCVKVALRGVGDARDAVVIGRPVLGGLACEVQLCRNDSLPLASYLLRCQVGLGGGKLFKIDCLTRAHW